MHLAGSVHVGTIISNVADYNGFVDKKDSLGNNFNVTLLMEINYFIAFGLFARKHEFKLPKSRFFS